MRHDFDKVDSSYYKTDKVDSSYYKTDKGRTDRLLLCSYKILTVQFTYQLFKLFLV